MLLGYARRLIAINREAVSKFIIPDIVGVVRLGSPDDFGERVLPHVLRRFAQTHPSIAVDVVIDQSVNLRRRMDDRTLDITLMTNSTGAAASAETLLTERIVWAGAKGGCAHMREPLPISVWEEGCSLAAARDGCAGPRRPQLPRRLYECAHRRAARRNHGRPCDRAAAEVLHHRRNGRTWLEGRAAGHGRLRIAMMVTPDASAPVKAAADHIRAAFELFRQTGRFEGQERVRVLATS